MANAMNGYASTDNLGLISKGIVMRDLGFMDPEEFQNKYRQHFTRNTMANLLAYQQNAGGGYSPQRFAKFRQQRDMEMAKRRAEQGPVTPDETNAMNY